MELAPILVSVYDRVNHLRKCVDSLRGNPLSKDSRLYIVSDAAHAPQYAARIAAVREYIGQVEGFGEVIPIQREKNLGSFLSINTAIASVLERHGRVIFLEDDNVVAPNFLKFLNDCLEFYKEDTSVFSVCAYNYPFEAPSSYEHDVYKWQGFSAWGVGLWADRWKSIEWSYPGFDKSVKSGLDRIGEHLYELILHSIEHGKKAADVMISYELFRHTRYSIFPVIPKIRNTGADGTGEHMHVTDRYEKQSLDSGGNYRLVKNLEPDPRMNEALRRYFQKPLKARIFGGLCRISPRPLKDWVKGILPLKEKSREVK